ncbi:hypothetical protein EMCRGX_G029815 [Ephydatia muelleri]
MSSYKSGNVVIRFWDLALREHARYNKAGVYDEPLSSFFRNVDTSSGNITEHPLGDGKTKIQTLKARESVVGGLLKGPLGELFDNRQLITDVSGSGNNWVVGNRTYGSKYHDQIVDTVRRSAESCDHLQSFFMMHSMGGGTGSGVGTRILEILRDEYPDVHRFSVVVYPSEKDDVITSPYNCVLAHRELTENADCVLPIENQALSDICGKAVASQSKHTSSSARQCSSITKDKPFDEMNNVVANLLLALTSASRFEGSLNVDLNEITMNLVPFPRLHYLVTITKCAYQCYLLPHRLDQSFSDAFSPEYQLIKANPKHGLYLACALLLRGQVNVSDVRRNIERLRSSLRFVHWNQDGWKTGALQSALSAQGTLASFSGGRGSGGRPVHRMWGVSLFSHSAVQFS